MVSGYFGTLMPAVDWPMFNVGLKLKLRLQSLALKNVAARTITE